MKRRFIHETWINHPPEAAMPDVTTLDEARELAGRLERREHFRHGGTRAEARARLARRIGVMPGTLYNLARDRLKRFDNSLRLALTTYARRDLQIEIERLTHELEITRKMGAGSRNATTEVAALEARMAMVKSLMESANASS